MLALSPNGGLWCARHRRTDLKNIAVAINKKFIECLYDAFGSPKFGPTNDTRNSAPVHLLLLLIKISYKYVTYKLQKSEDK